MLRDGSLAERHFQLWLAEQLELRSRGFYSVSREEEVIGGRRPDIRITSTVANAKVSLEVKLADNCSGAELRSALTQQLADYERDPRCRHGILVLIARGTRSGWRLNGRVFRSVTQLSAVLGRLAVQSHRANSRCIRSEVVPFELVRKAADFPR